jgi:hypothetical protein
LIIARKRKKKRQRAAQSAFACIGANDLLLESLARAFVIYQRSVVVAQERVLSAHLDVIWRHRETE